MSGESNTNEAPTRRECVKYGGAVIGGGLLAGCASRSGSDSGSTPTETSTGDDSIKTATDAETESETTTENGSYSATMPPMGELTLEEPPSTWIGGLGFTADVLTALGQADGAVGMADPRFWYQGFYAFLDGVTAPAAEELNQFTTEDRDTDLEVLYELDPDLMAVDPNPIIAVYGLDKGGAAEIQENVAPWFGNESRRKRFDGWTYWPGGEPYPYLSLPEYIPK